MISVMKTNFSLLFYMKKQKNYKTGPAPIYLRITVDGQRTEITTGRMCEPAKWNSESGRATGSKEEARTFNSFLDSLQSKVYEAHRLLSEGSDPITAEALKNRMLGKDESVVMLMDVFRDHNRKVATLVGKEFSAGTLERYETSLKHTEEFLISHYGVNDIDIRKIDNAFISEYDFFLRSVRKCANNSAVKYIKNFGKIVRICLSNGWITVNPFTNYKGRVKNVERVFLSEEELQKIADKDFATSRLAQVRDVFLFCCYTGLAYADVKKLRTDQIRTGVDGGQWIFTNRQKTDTRSAIPLLPVAAMLVEKYAGHPLCVNAGTPLPVPSNQKMNDYLKEIATVCGINKSLTSHIARHTFATTVTLSNGVPIESVSKMLGHSSLKQTQHYAKILDVKVSADMSELKKKLGAQPEAGNKPQAVASSVRVEFSDGRASLYFSMDQVRLIDEAILAGESQFEATSPTGFWFQAAKFWSEGTPICASKRELDIIIIKSLEPYLRCPVEQKRKMAANLSFQLYDILVDERFEQSKNNAA